MTRPRRHQPRRLTAAERREQLIDAAITAFGTTGYVGTSIADIARLAGVSQPYVIRLFGAKRSLFLAAVEHACARIEELLRQAARDTPDLSGLAEAFAPLLTERELLGVLLHSCAASFDETIAEVVRRRCGRIYEVVREITGAPPEEVRSFLAHGMLVTVLAAVRVIGPDAVSPEPRLTELINSFPSFRRAA